LRPITAIVGAKSVVLPPSAKARASITARAKARQRLFARFDSFTSALLVLLWPSWSPHLDKWSRSGFPGQTGPEYRAAVLISESRVACPYYHHVRWVEYWGPSKHNAPTRLESRTVKFRFSRQLKLQPPGGRGGHGAVLALNCAYSSKRVKVYVRGSACISHVALQW